MKINTLNHGDCLDVMREWPDACIDLIATDPPYGPGTPFEDAWRGTVPLSYPDTDLIVIFAQRTCPPMHEYLGFMIERLREMRRILKPTGSIYLQCDPTASHYLKAIMDAIFGGKQFRNELSWRRSNPKSLGTINFPNCRDIIFRYSVSEDCPFNKVFAEHDPEYVRRAYKYQELDGRRYRLLPLLNPNNDRPNLTYEFLGVTRVWRWTQERMKAAYDDGLVVQIKPGAVPQYKKYLEDSKGRTITNDWNDIEQAAGKESTGYPTQKPLALLRRIIEVSSNEGDIVLDPFAGCATTLVAADMLGRQWVGIDASAEAIEEGRRRLREG